MIHIRYLQEEDKPFWFGLDKHITETEYDRKVRDRMGYVLLEEAQHFYRKAGDQDAGGLVLTVPGYEQPMELFFVKAILNGEGNTAS